jgi:hypothetical protein
LRGFARTQRGEKPAVQVIQDVFKRIEREVAKLATEDVDEARNVVEDGMARLQAILDELGATPTVDPTITQTLRARPIHTRQPAPAGRAHA